MIALRLSLNTIKYAFVVTALLASATLAAGRQPTFKSGVDVVYLDVTVQAPDGSIVRGLAKEDFLIYDEEAPQEVAVFSAEPAPISVGVLIDTSGSMTGERMAAATRAADALGRSLQSGDQWSISTFDSTRRTMISWRPYHPGIVNSLRAMPTSGSTELFKAVTEMVPYMKETPHRKRAMLLMTDGIDNSIIAASRDGRGDPFEAPGPLESSARAQAALRAGLSMKGNAVAGPLDDAQAAHGKRDYATALRLWRPLADQGNAEAQYALGSMYAGGQGVPKNNTEAAKWWRLAADQGNTFAQYNLGTLYDDGKGVPQNKAEALKLYHLAAERGNDGAQFSVGVLYFAGVAVPENRIEAAKWFRRAADQGHIGAQVYLALSYATGLGVPQDNVQAYMWLSVAAARGDKDAISNRNRVAQKLTPVQIAGAQKLAREWKSKPER